MRFKKLPPLDYIKEILHYDPNTGTFTWKQKLSAKQYIGDEAGSTDNKGYRILRIRKSNYKAHRIAYYYMTGCDPAHSQVDHVDENKSNNSFDNLRLCDNSGNQHNIKRRIGVYFRADHQRWISTITIKGIRYNLGSFLTEAEATTAYHTRKQELCTTQNLFG